MKSILTPIRRQLAKSADRHLLALVNQRHDGSTGSNAMIGLGIRRGMIYRRLKEIAIHEDAIPSGTVQVPPREKRNEPFSCAMEGFEVDLDKLNARLAAAPVSRQQAARPGQAG